MQSKTRHPTEGGRGDNNSKRIPGSGGRPTKKGLDAALKKKRRTNGRMGPSFDLQKVEGGKSLKKERNIGFPRKKSRWPREKGGPPR